MVNRKRHNCNVTNVLFTVFTLSVILVAIGIFSSVPYVFSESQTQISIPPNTSTAGCDKNNSCYLPFKITVGQGSTVTWVNNDSKSHTVTSGDPFEGPDEAFDSGLIKTGKSFSMTLSKQGTFTYFCQLHPWAIGQIVVGERDSDQEPTSQPIPEPSPKPEPEPIPEPTSEPVNEDTVSPDVHSSGTGELLKIKVNLSDKEQGTSVTITVIDANGNEVFTKTTSPDSKKINDIEFSVSDDSIIKSFSTSPSDIVTSAELSESSSDPVTTIASQFMSKLSIISVEPTDMQGNPVSSFTRGQMGFAKISLDVKSKGTALIAVNLLDLKLTSIGVGSIKSSLDSGSSEMIISFFIPDDATPGTANIYVNAYSDWPSNGGVPLTKEFLIQANIQ